VDIGYARVSSVHQDTAIQLLDLERAGCHPIYEETVSGVSDKRPVRNAALARLKRGDTLTVWKLDRLGRSVSELLDIVEDLDTRGVRFRCLTQPIDTTSAAGRMFLTFLAAFAAFERELLLERTAAGKLRRLQEGKHPGGPALFGWRPGNEEVDEEEAAALDTMVRMVVDQGMNQTQVVEHLNRHLAQFPRSRRGGHWRATTLRRILTNPRTKDALAVFTRDDEDVDRRWIDLQRIVNRNAGRGQGQGGGRPAEHLLSGILVCGREGCGAPLHSAQKLNKNGTPYRFYRCKRGTGSGGRFGGCGSTQVSEARADAWAEELFVSTIASDDFSEALSRRRAELLAGEVTVEQLDDWRAELGDIEQVQGTRFYDDAIRRRHEDLRRMVNAATARLLAQPDLQALADLPKNEEQLQAAWASWTVTERRTWLRRVFKCIEVKPAPERHGAATDVESRLYPVWRI
jgi:DNA invertase Pin-like site-specific DNA recombinase